MSLVIGERHPQRVRANTSTTTTRRARTGRGRARAAGLCSRRVRGRWLRSRASVGFITNTAGGRRPVAGMSGVPRTV